MSQWDLYYYCKDRPNKKFSTKDLSQALGKKHTVGYLASRLVRFGFLKADTSRSYHQPYHRYWWDNTCK